MLLKESLDLIDELREEILQQIKLREKFRDDFEQSEANYKLDLHEREQIEELLNRDLTNAKDEIRKTTKKNETMEKCSFVQLFYKVFKVNTNELFRLKRISKNNSNNVKKNWKH